MRGSTTQVNFRIDSNVKEEAYEVLKAIGTSPADFVKDMFEYVAREKKIPVKRHVVSNEDMELLAIAKERLQTMKEADVIRGITPDDLFAQHPSNRAR